MKQYLTIVKLIFRNMLKFDKTKSKGLLVGVIAAFGFLFLLIDGALVFVIIAAEGLIPGIWEAIANELIAVLFMAGAVIVAIFGIMSMLRLLYFSPDTEFFLALPVKPGTVFAAKFTVIYLTELLLAAALLLPPLLTLGVVAGMPALYFPVVLLGILFAPSIPLVLASIIGIPLMYVVGFFKNKGALSSVVILVLFAAVFGAYYFFIAQLQNIDGSGFDEAAVAALYDGLQAAANAVYPYLALAKLSSGTPVFGLDPALSALVNFGLSFGVVAVLIALAVFISSMVYARGAAAQLESGKKKATGRERHTQSSALKALALREWKMMIRTPSFAMSCLMPIVMAPLVTAFMAYMFGSGGAIAGEQGLDLFNPNTTWYVSMAMIFIMGVGMNMAASTAFTREGKGFYIAKTFPVDVKTQIRAKMIVYMLISLVSISLSALIVMFIAPNPLFLLLSIIVLSVYAYGFNCFVVLFDLMRPKLDWTTPNEAMKQNVNILVPLFINMGVGLVLMAAGVVLPLMFTDGIAADIGIWVIYAAFAAAAAVLFHRLLYGKAEQYFERLG